MGTSGPLAAEGVHGRRSIGARAPSGIRLQTNHAVTEPEAVPPGWSPRSAARDRRETARSSNRVQELRSARRAYAKMSPFQPADARQTQEQCDTTSHRSAMSRSCYGLYCSATDLSFLRQRILLQIHNKFSSRACSGDVEGEIRRSIRVGMAGILGWCARIATFDHPVPVAGA